MSSVHANSTTSFDFILQQNSKFMDLMMTIIDHNATTCYICHRLEPALNTCCSESTDPQYIGLHCYPASDYTKLRSRVDRPSQTQSPTAVSIPSSTT